MNLVKFFLNIDGNGYICKNASNIGMNILGDFLASDVYRPLSYIEWFSNDRSKYASGNLTVLKKEGNYILLSDQFSEEEIPSIFKITHKQFVQIVNDWEEKVLKLKPKEVIIKYENDEFTIETKD